MVFIAPLLAIVLLIWAADAFFYTPKHDVIEKKIDKNSTQKDMNKIIKK